MELAKALPLMNTISVEGMAKVSEPVNISYGSEESLKLKLSLEQCRNRRVFELPAIQSYINNKWDESRYYLHLFLLLSDTVIAFSNRGRTSNAAKALSLVLFTSSW